MSTGRALRSVMLAIGIVAVSAMVMPPATVAAATDRLPDLKAAHIRDLRIVNSGGRRLLRFTGMFWNRGPGPFEIRASRSSRSTPWDVDQIIYDTDGRTRRLETDARLRYAGDGHDHWHVRQMLSYHLWGSRGTLRDAKVGFCFFDTNLIDGAIPRSPSRPVYTESMCGHRGALRTRNGISVGWGDKYPWNFAYQWIDISGLPGGTYTLRAAVDLYDSFDETTRANNCAWARIRFGATGRSVTVLERGFGCVDDHSATRYAADVAWARAAGVSQGCDADLFCTNNPMTRGQLATFLARAMRLPAATKDYFTDDETNANETNINKIAEAGVTAGCRTRMFCPTQQAKRDQVASFLARALDPPGTSGDFFTDDEGSRFENAINRLAAAGVAIGCGGGRYCPDKAITRGQLVAMLRRGFETPPG